jgi:single-stranded-DNA-specific exonuclease
MNKQWVLREKVSENLEEQLLFYRDINLNPDYERDLHDPFEILNIEKAVERILAAIKNNEKIVIFGDYDADGVCATVIFHDFFKKIGFENFHAHIPDRNLEGYGLNLNAIDEFIEQKAKLIITLDCGITDIEEVEKANQNSMDVIIIDHHLAPEKLPNAFAVVDSKQKKDKYPFKDLCGAGVAFKTIQALIKKGSAQGGQGFNIVPGWEKWLLDLVAIATVADMVPLVNENRTLVFYGLQVLRKTRRPGLISLFRRLDINPNNTNEDDVAFMLAPRINISGRMGHANTSFELLTTESSGEADWITSHLEMLSNERRNIVENILKEIDKRIAEKDKLPEVVVEGDLRWNPGVIGLAAARMVEKYRRPVFLWGKGEVKEIKGSCRGDGSVNLVELMQKLPEGILFDSGGHFMAGGFSSQEDKIDDFEKEILKAYKKIPKQKIENDILYIDKEIFLDDINWDFYSIIEKFQPFGIGNPKPVFLLSDLEIAKARKFGNAGIHLQLDFKKSDESTLSAIGFFFNNNLNFKIGLKIDLAASLEKSFFRPPAELRLCLIDVNPVRSSK